MMASRKPNRILNSTARRPTKSSAYRTKWLLSALGGKKERFGGGGKSKSSRRAVLRGALALHGSGNSSAARELIKLLKSQEVFEKALTEVVNDHFGITGWT